MKAKKNRKSEEARSKAKNKKLISGQRKFEENKRIKLLTLKRMISTKKSLKKKSQLTFELHFY